MIRRIIIGLSLSLLIIPGLLSASQEQLDRQVLNPAQLQQMLCIVKFVRARISEEASADMSHAQRGQALLRALKLLGIKVVKPSAIDPNLSDSQLAVVILKGALPSERKVMLKGVENFLGKSIFKTPAPSEPSTNVAASIFKGGKVPQLKYVPKKVVPVAKTVPTVEPVVEPGLEPLPEPSALVKKDRAKSLLDKFRKKIAAKKAAAEVLDEENVPVPSPVPAPEEFVKEDRAKSLLDEFRKKVAAKNAEAELAPEPEIVPEQVFAPEPVFAPEAVNEKLVKQDRAKSLLDEFRKKAAAQKAEAEVTSAEAEAAADSAADSAAAAETAAEAAAESAAAAEAAAEAIAAAEASGEGIMPEPEEKAIVEKDRAKALLDEYREKVAAQQAEAVATAAETAAEAAAAAETAAESAAESAAAAEAAAEAIAAAEVAEKAIVEKASSEPLHYEYTKKVAAAPLPEPVVEKIVPASKPIVRKREQGPSLLEKYRNSASARTAFGSNRVEPLILEQAEDDVKAPVEESVAVEDFTKREVKTDKSKIQHMRKVLPEKKTEGYSAMKSVVEKMRSERKDRQYQQDNGSYITEEI